MTLILRDEALLMLQGGGAILRTARELSDLFRREQVDAAVIGGVAVVLHGHVRTTIDVDFFTPGPADEVSALLERAGFAFDASKREFSRDGVPVHLVRPGDVGLPPEGRIDIEDVRTIPLGELISMKLQSGSRNVLRSQDLADVIGMIRSRGLSASFAGQVHKSVRPEFRKLVRAVAKGA